MSKPKIDDMKKYVEEKERELLGEIIRAESIDGCFDKHFNSSEKIGIEKRKNFITQIISNVEEMKKITYGQFKHIEDDMWWEARLGNKRWDKKCFSDILQCHLFRLGIMVKNKKIKTLRQARKERWKKAQRVA